MAVKLQRPILVGGISLAYGLWLLQSLHHSLIQLGEFGLVGAIAIGSCFWLFQQKTQETQLPPEILDRATVEKAIAQAADAVNCLSALDDCEALARLRERVARLGAELNRQEIQVAVTGGKSVGKTTLIQVLETSLKLGETPRMSLHLQETPALFTPGLKAGTKTPAITADLVLLVTDGDLTDSEFRTLQQLGVNQRLVLVFNKQDQLPGQAAVLISLRQRLHSLLGIENVVATSASPNPIKVRQHQPDGSIQEWLETPPPDTEQLSQLLAQILTQEGQQLVWASTHRMAHSLKTEAKTLLNAARRKQALPVVEQYQWIAAAAAFANPVPALDLLAAGAINAQLIMDLSKVYQQKFSLQQAQAVAGTLGSLIVKLGLVELSTQTVSGILKSNAVTFVAGGAVQGVSAAYLTRLAGLSLIEYFQEQELSASTGSSLNLDRLKLTLQRVFQQNRRMAFLQSFVNQAVGRLLPSQQLQTTSGNSLEPIQ